ncbi:DUF4254 domain-containing protein [Saccharothrix sp. AJ9571]|nr:DUF4254 domain-containing protein [Saccharothrix sp. AJ9571]
MIHLSSVVMQHETVSDGHHHGNQRLEIPRAATVVRAFSHPSEAGDRHVVLAVAAKLAAEHHMRAQARQLTHDPHADDHMMAAAARTLAARETACAVLIEQIDRWAAVEFGESRATVLHTETLGQLVDRLAAVWTRSRLIANAAGPAASTWARVALHQLGELCTGFDDLVTDVERGRRRLPVHQTPTGPDVAA